MKKVILILIFIANLGFALDLPKACVENCHVPFGEVLGKAKDGLEGYSNCNEHCVFQEPNFVNKEFSGIKWQCVEFARRYLLNNKKISFPSIDVAADIWTKLDAFSRPGTAEKISITKFQNGSTTLPVEGDLLIYSRDYLGTGHVAIIAKVDQRKNTIDLLEQNYTNQKWTGANYTRRVEYVRRGKKVWILDPYLLGWINYSLKN